MGEYDRQIASAHRQIQAKGQKVTWRQVLDGAPADPDKPWKPGTAITPDNDVYIAFFPISSRPSQRYRDGTTVPTGNLYGIMEAVDFVPTLKDVIIRGTETLTVNEIDPLDPNGEGAIIYELELTA